MEGPRGVVLLWLRGENGGQMSVELRSQERSSLNDRVQSFQTAQSAVISGWL